MKQRGTTILLLVVLLVGLSLLAYPRLANWWNSMHQSRAVMSYTDSVSNLNREEYDQILGDAWFYNKAWVENGISVFPARASPLVSKKVYRIMGQSPHHTGAPMKIAV